jgi:single-stranded DNA-binding protein
MTGMRVEIDGTIRTHNTKKDDKTHLDVYLFADSFHETDLEDENKVNLMGNICRQPYYRKTPLGRQITDLLLAVNMPYGRSYYIPLITWGRNAVYVSGKQTGTKLAVIGRFQSRVYNKTIDDECVDMTAYEVSVYWTTFDPDNQTEEFSEAEG